MAGSLGKRIRGPREALQRRFREPSNGPEGWQEKIAASLKRAEEKAAAEEVQGDSRRRHALDNLYKFMERRPDGA